MSEFFRYHGVWAPGVRLFRSLRFRAKALLISAALVLPAVVLGAAYLQAVLEQVEFTQKERDGVAAMQSFVPVLLGVLETRNATRALLGDFDAAQDYQAARGRVDQSLQALDAHLRDSGDPLALSGSVAALQQAWVATASSKNGADEKGRTVFGKVTEASLKVLQEVTENSNLVLDPDLDTLYTIMALFVDLPKTAEDLGQLWGWSTFAMARGGLENPEQYRRYAVWNARAGAGIESARYNLGRAFAANPALKESIPLEALDAALKYQSGADPTQMIKDAIDPAEAYAAGQKAVRTYFKVFDAALPALDGLLKVRLARLEQSRNLRGAVVLASLLLAAYLFTCFARVMDGGLKEVARHLNNMADGDLTQSPRPWGNDEAAHLMRALGRMQEAMRTIVHDVRESSHSLVSVSGEIAAGAANLSGRTEQAAAELQQTASSLEQISATVGHTTDNTHKAAALAAQNAQAAQKSGQVIEGAVATMAEISAASRRIGDIIGTIDGIAFQTNILALNAAVEAARAGEQGRGFAVVAGEVRQLAQRSAAAAREIKSLITDTVQRVSTGTGVVETAGVQVKALVGGVGEISSLIGAISTAAQQQSSGVRQVGNAVSGLDQMTQQNAALVEQTAAASETLRQRADQLVHAVSRFRIDEDADGAGPSLCRAGS